MEENNGDTHINSKFDLLYSHLLFAHHLLSTGIESAEVNEKTDLYTHAKSTIDEAVSKFGNFGDDPLVKKLLFEIITKGQQLEEAVNRSEYFVNQELPKVETDGDITGAFDQMIMLFKAYLHVIDIRERLKEGGGLGDYPPEYKIPLDMLRLASIRIEAEKLGERYPLLNDMMTLTGTFAQELNDNAITYAREGQRKKESR